MKPGDTGVFLRELVSLLPKKSPDDWCEIAHAEDPKATVVVVCGFGASHRSVSAIRKRLLRDGYDVVVLAMTLSELSDGVLGLRHMAERLSLVVQSLAKKSLPVFLVAHSAGGLVARYFVQALEGHLYTQGVVTLATPHRGTWVAALGFVTPLILKAKVLWEMLPVSQFIRTLNKAPLASTVQVLSIRSKRDMLCPPHATRLPRRWKDIPNVRGVDLEDLSHMEFLMSKECYLLVEKFLAERMAQLAPSTDVAGGKRS